MIELTAAEIAAMTGGRLIGEPVDGSADTASVTVDSAVTDSREAGPGSLFVAKPGESTDGHRFVLPAFGSGAVLALTEREVTDDGGRILPQIVVPDAVEAMGALAAGILGRLRANGPLDIVGITGSAGKTTTKDLLAGILAQAGPTVAPVGSYNGEVGVPLTIFNTDSGTRYLVVEMGATGIGHITYLTDMVKPHTGVVLCVGSAHAGEFGGVDNIARAKGELVEALQPEGTAVLNADDQRVRAMSSRTTARQLFFTADDGFTPDAPEAQVIRATELGTTADGHPEFTLVFPDGTRKHVRSGLIGSHHVANLLAAASAAWSLGISADLIASGLEGRGPASRWRMERTERPDGVTVINDAYNANPESMRAALRTLAELGRGEGRRTWAVLGEMLELGDDAVLEHDAIGRIVVRLNIARLIVVGAGAKAMHNAAVMEGSWGDESMFVETPEDAYRVLQEELLPGDLVLFKSSNGAGLRFLGDRVAQGGSGQAGSQTAEEEGLPA
jgi:UDP-N-acetylmuramoyl-tripeptide--D-alanyl-D-alanine ligase